MKIAAVVVKTATSRIAALTGLKIFWHSHFDYDLMLKIILAYARKMEPKGIRNNDLHSRLEWEMVIEGVQYPEFKDMLLYIAKDLESRLLIMGIAYGQHLRAVAEGKMPGKLFKPLGVFSWHTWHASSRFRENTVLG
jgi:hypothetical protein